MILLRFFIDERPMTWNTFYAGTHWAKRRRISERWHTLTLGALGDRRPRIDECYIVAVAHIRGRAHIPDASNICIKPVEDTLVHAGILADDNPDHVKGVFLRVRTGSPRTGLEIILVEDMADIAEIG